MPTNYEQIADFLTEGKPLAHALRFDGSLAVVAANGQKFIFTPEEVVTAENALLPAPKTPPAPKKAPSAPKKPK